MARGTTFSELRLKVRAEARLSTNTSRGLDSNDYIDQIINRVYETLWDDHDWSFLRILKSDAGKALASGQRYYDYPVKMSVETIERVWAKFGNVWHELEYGIPPDIYNDLDSDDDERSDPPLRWMIRDEDQFEIWPLPASNDGELRFEGRRAFTELVDDTDRAEIDDILITLIAAGEILASQNQKDAQVKFDQASRRLGTLAGRTAGRTTVNFARGGMDKTRTSGVRLRAVYNDRTP